MPTAPPGTPAVREIAQRLGPNHRMTVMSGAGVSAASGIPTFRGPGGVWGIHRAEDLATPEGFARDPVLVWEWYDWRRQQVAAARPNPAHDVLARWSRNSDHFTLITQNVDGLHERAGARDVVRFHGSIWELRCWNTCTSRVAGLYGIPPVLSSGGGSAGTTRVCVPVGPLSETSYCQLRGSAPPEIFQLDARSNVHAPGSVNMHDGDVLAHDAQVEPDTAQEIGIDDFML